MGCRMIWQDLYAVQTVADTLANVVAGSPTWNPSADKGIQGLGTAGGKFTMLLMDHVDFKAPTATVETALTTNKPLRKTIEYNQVAAQPPTVTLKMLANAYNLSLFMMLLYQTGATEAVGSTNSALNVLTCVPYTSSTISYWGDFIKIMGDGAEAYDQLIKGGICRSLTLEAEEGGLLTLTAEIVGLSWSEVNTDAGDLTAMQAAFDDTTPLKWQDATVKLGGAVVNSPKFSITITNEPKLAYYNNSTIANACIGGLKGEGSITIPWADTNAGTNTMITNYRNGTDTAFELYWGAVTGADTLTPKGGGSDTKNYFAIKANIRVTDYTVAGDDEIVIDTNFAAVEDPSATNNTLCLYAGYDKTLLERI